MLHFDILRSISLHCHPFKLSICNSLHNMYDDIWYYDKLLLLYPNLNLFTTTNYKDLYDKSLDQGKVSYTLNFDTFHELGRIGVKASLFDEGNIILTFNGDLWCNDVLLDRNVVDITTNSYIKTNELYVYSNNKWNKIEVHDKKLFRIEYDIVSEYIAIMSENGVLLRNSYGNISFVKVKDVDMFYLCVHLYISNKRHEVYSTDLSANNLTLIRRHDIKIKNNTTYNNDDKLIYIIIDCVHNTVYNNSYIYSIPFEQNFKILCYFKIYAVILSNNKCHIYRKSGPSVYSKDDILENVKNIYSSNTRFFYIIN